MRELDKKLKFLEVSNAGVQNNSATISALQPLFCSSGNWREELQTYVAPEQLPQDFGGTRCEPDPECTDHVSAS